MPIDPRIALGVQQLQLQDPLAQYAKVAQIQNYQQQQKNAAFDSAMNRYKFAVQQVRTPDEYMAVNDWVHSDPTLGPILGELGVSSAASRANIEQMLSQPGGLDALKNQSLMSADEFAEWQRNRAASAALGGGAATPPTQPAATQPTAAQPTYGRPIPQGNGVNAMAVAPQASVAGTALPSVNAMAMPAVTPAPATAPAQTNALAVPQPTALQNQIQNHLVEANRLSKIALAYPGTQAAVQAANAATFERQQAQFLQSQANAQITQTPSAIREAQWYTTATPEQRAAYDQMLMKKKPAGAQFVMPPAQTAEQKARGERLDKQYGEISTAARQGAKLLPVYESNLNILDKGFKTGWLAPTKVAAARVLSALGVEDADNYAATGQMFNAKAQEMVLQKQLDQKGPQTEADAQRITQTGAQIGNEVDANRFLLDVAKAQVKRDMAQRKFYDTWYREHKVNGAGTYEGAEDAWYEGEGGKSLFDYPELAKYKPGATPKRTESLDKIFGAKR